MTGRELRLRERIDTLTDQRDTALAKLAVRRQRGGRRFKRCVYCSDPSGSSLACGSHRDLLSLDPYYALDRGLLASTKAAA